MSISKNTHAKLYIILSLTATRIDSWFRDCGLQLVPRLRVLLLRLHRLRHMDASETTRVTFVAQVVSVMPERPWDRGRPLVPRLR